MPSKSKSPQTYYMIGEDHVHIPQPQFPHQRIERIGQNDLLGLF